MKRPRVLSSIGKLISFHSKSPQLNQSLLQQTRKNKNIIYGARSINKQIHPLLRRRTYDYDILSPTPKKSAQITEKNYDKIIGSNQFYVKPALHPGTWKVMHIGSDMKKATKDDIGYVDYSKTPRPVPKYKVINGIRYRKLCEEEKAKLKSLNDPQMAFRHKKDLQDLKVIRQSKRLLRRR